jgi:tetratricopeptide (TPR) repeat protein
MHRGTVIADRFRIEQLAGGGGMSSVYRARDLARDVDVAIKVGRVAGHDEARRMAREAQALAEHLMALRHPHIVEYVAHGITADQQPYLVMEWLEGHDLAARLEQGPLAEGDVIALAGRLARTLSLMHGCGIVHRDIKPGNVFLVRGDLAAVKLIDFGLVFLDMDLSRVTPSGVYLGTPGFMAPEQIREPRAVDGRADLYALGALMFACLTRRLPFEGNHLTAVLGKLLFEEAPRVRELRPDVSPALDALIARLLGKSPSDRPASADALAAELERLGEPARPGDAQPLPERMAVTHGEQRFFTVLLAGPVAPDALDDVSAALASVAASHEAEVARLAERTLLAMFTGDRALEDTAARAAHGALALRASGLAVPMVLATGRGRTDTRLPVGEVVERAAALRFGPARRAAHEDYVLIDTMGNILGAQPDADDAPAIATATVPMAEVAVDGILLDEVTARLLEGRFAIEPHAGPGFRLHGELPAARTGRPPARPAGPCLGRERELSHIEQLFDECIESSTPRAVLVAGPPGMGKSRLAEELVHRVDVHTAGAAAVWRAGGDPARVGSSLGLLARLILHATGGLQADSAAEQRAALASRVRARVAAGDAARVVAFLSEIAGLPHAGEGDLQLREARRDARLMHDQMLRAWEDWLDAEAAAGPVVLILDDLQWADAPSVRFVERALCHLGERPIFALGLARPELDEVLPDAWSACHPDRMPLRPLARQACAALAQHHAAAALSPDRLARVIERADGNPLYIEELVRHGGGGTAAMPDTLLALVGMRLAALPAEERRVLRAASVFGRHFRPGGVAALLGEDPGAGGVVSAVIERLIARDLVLPERHAPGRGEDAYRLRHDLVREAAYATLLAGDLVAAHRQAAVWLEQAGERDAFALAEHYRRGHAPAQALPWFCRAAEQALAADDVQAVVERVEGAIACGAGGETLGSLCRLQAEAQNWSGQNQAAHDSAVTAMTCLPRGSEEWALAAHQRAWAAAEIGNGEDIVRVAAELLACKTQPLGDACLIAMARCMSNLRVYGLVQEAGQLLAHVESEARMQPPSVAGTILHMRGFLASFDDRWDVAAAWLMRAIEQWDLMGNRRQACLDRGNLSVCLCQLGQYEESIEAGRHALAQARRLSVVHLIHSSNIPLALSLARQGRHAEAEQHVPQSPDDSPRKQMLHAIHRAWLALFASRPEAALAEVEQAVALAESPGGAHRRVALTLRARALLDLGRASEALATARAAMELMEHEGAGKEGEALLRVTHAEALHATGAPEQARAALAAARTWVLDRAGQIENPDWRRSFLDRVAENRRILELAHAWGLDRAR